VSGPEGDDGVPAGGQSSGGPRPDPLDRTWVHPSELRSYVANPLPPAPPRPREWAIGLGSAAVGVAATVLVLVAFGALGERNRSPLPPPVVIPENHVIDYSVAARVSQAVEPSIVEIRATAGDVTTTGSGVAISSNRVLTSAHLLVGAATVSVSTYDGRSFTAKIMGSDVDTDLILLEVSGANLAYRPLSDDEPKIGQPVVAMAVTRGANPYVGINVVSARNVLVTTATGSTIAGLLQVGIPTSPETSGGALFDTFGRIVGILTTPPGVPAQGLAVRMSVADDVRDQIEASGSVTHGWLGITAVDARDRPGARITAVLPDSPAATAALDVGDVIVEAGGHPIRSAGDLVAEWRRRRPQDLLMLVYRRDRGSHRTTATLAAPPQPGPPGGVQNPAAH